MKMTYEWKAQSLAVFKAINPRRVHRMVAEKTAEEIVDEARGGGALLHDCFEWDDGVAAELHRVNTAKELCRSILVTYERDEEEVSRTVRAVMSLPNEEGEYRFTSHVRILSDDELLARAKSSVRGRLACARKELEGWQALSPDLSKAVKHIQRAEDVLAAGS